MRTYPSASKIPAKYLSKIRDEIVSPAELVNFYRTSDNSKEFIQKILDKHAETCYIIIYKPTTEEL